MPSARTDRPITRYGRLHVGVGVQAALEVEDVREAGAREEPRHVGAADAVVADDDRLGLRVELGNTRRNPSVSASCEPSMREWAHRRGHTGPRRCSFGRG